MVTNSELVVRLREILRNSDLDTATAGSVRRQLEADFGVDLSYRKGFVREQIDAFLETLNNNEEEDKIEEGIAEENEPNEEGSDVQNGDAEGEEEEEEAVEEVTDKGKENKKGRSSKGGKEVKRRGGGFAKVCCLSPQLQEVVGVPELARTEVVKRLWAYIREKNLQDPNDKRMIRCDDALRSLFHVNSINMFQMNKALSKHIWPLASGGENEKPKIESQDLNSLSEGSIAGQEVEEQGENEEHEPLEKGRKGQTKKGGSDKIDKEVKKRGGGFTKLCSLSPELQEIVGVPKLARTGVVKKLWDHIHEKNLQDPTNKRNIICDESLRFLFEVDSIDMFQMNKALSKHIWPLNGEDALDNSNVKERREKKGREEVSESDEPDRSEKRQKKGASGLESCCSDSSFGCSN